MSCILRVSGESLNIDELLSSNTIEFDRLWRKGESRIANKHFYSTSGVQFIVSEADFDDFITQRQDAIDFLQLNEAIISKISSNRDVQYCVLDFGVSITPDNVSVMSYFTPELISLAAKVGAGIELSCYLCDDGDDQS